MRTISEMKTDFHINTHGVEFKIRLIKKHLTDEHTYWLYFAVAEHEGWRPAGFQIMATKAAFPKEELADLLASTQGLASVKGLLEHSTEEMPKQVMVPDFACPEGWVVC